jgi:hypothetical protein
MTAVPVTQPGSAFSLAAPATGFECSMLNVGLGAGFFRFTLSSGSDSPGPLTAMFDPTTTFGTVRLCLVLATNRWPPALADHPIHGNRASSTLTRLTDTVGV